MTNHQIFKQGQEFVPLFSIKKASVPFSKLTKEDICNNKDLINSYIEDNEIIKECPVNRAVYTRMSQSEIFNKISKISWEVVRNNNNYYLVTQYGLFRIKNNEVTPLVIAMVHKDHVPALKMSSLLEIPFPVEAISIWVNQEHGLSTIFYNDLLATFYESLNHAKVTVVELSEDDFFKYLFKTYTKPTFLMQSQVVTWKKQLLDEFRKKK